MNPSLERLGYCQRSCRPDGLPRRNWMKAGAEILFWFGFYKYAAPTALGTARRRKRRPGRSRSPFLIPQGQRSARSLTPIIFYQFVVLAFYKWIDNCPQFMKLEFVPGIEIPAHFIVAKKDIENFTQYLKSKNVCVHNIKHYLTDGDGDNFSLELQMAIPPEDGNQLVSTFQKKLDSSGLA